MNLATYHIAIPLPGRTSVSRIEQTAHYIKPLTNRLNPVITFLAGDENHNTGLSILDESIHATLESCGLSETKMIKKNQPLEQMVDDFIREHKPNMLILGLEDSGQTKLNEIDSKIIDTCRVPVMNIKGKSLADNIKNVILPVALSDDYDMIIRKAIKVLKPFRNLNLHVVSVLFSADAYSVNKATQQLSVINRFLEESDIKYTAEIINCLTPGENKSDIVTEHIRRVAGDLILLFKNQQAQAEEFIPGNKMRDIITKSSIPVISFT
jgi:hypothetical protein